MGPQFFCDADTPARHAEDIIPFLGKGIAHWRQGRSAYEAAHSWFDARDIPAPIRTVIGSDPVLAAAKLTHVYFERQTVFDDVQRGPSQTDVLAILTTDEGPAVLAIEAKVDEPFGPLVREWNDGSPAKRRRLAGLLRTFGLDEAMAASLRYQLLHRTAAALVEASQAHASRAALIVQSFSGAHAGFADFRAFTTAAGAEVPQPGRLSATVAFGGIGLRFGWATCPLRATAG